MECFAPVRRGGRMEVSKVAVGEQEGLRAACVWVRGTDPVEDKVAEGVVHGGFDKRADDACAERAYE